LRSAARLRAADRILMSGSLTQFTVRALDRLAVVLRRPIYRGNIPEHLRTGDSGEETAYFHLRKLGFVIVSRKFRSARTRGDIDLIAWEDDVLCFIEVKTRTTRDVKPPEAAVDQEKREQLGRVAREYLRNFTEIPKFRFDLLTIQLENRKAPEINLFKAFMSIS
jgi:putative endonuclease